MQILNAGTQLVAVDKLTPHPENPRRGDLDAIRASIRTSGFYGTIVAQKSTRHILAGNHRWEAARLEGLTKVPVVWVDVDDVTARRILAADNRTSDLGTYDEEALLELLNSIQQATGLEGTGYGIDDLDKLLADLDRGPRESEKPQIDASEALTTKWGVEPGQLWQVGDHRLLCGDGTNPTDVARLLDGETPTLLITDPPYGVELDPLWRDRVGLNRVAGALGTQVTGDDRADWTEAYEYAQATVAYVWHASTYTEVVAQNLRDTGYEIRQQIVWVKPMAPISRSAYHWRHEIAWYAVRKGASAPWHAGRDQNTVWEVAGPKQIFAGSDEEKQPHPTQKPIELYRRPIRNHLRERELAYDPFLGSGTAIAAAQELNRRCHGIDIEPRYIALTLERLTEHYNLTAQLL